MYRNIIRTLLAICIALFTSIPAEARIYLVSVGVSDYPGTRNDLNLPAADAKTIKWLYEKNSNTTTCILTNSNATCSKIISSMRRLFANAGTSDIVVLFFSGHGVKGGFCAYDGIIGYTEIREAFSECRSANKMIFADACFSGKMRGNKTLSSSVQAAKKANVMLFLSSRSNEMSIEKRTMKNGLFTSGLQNGLRGHADSNKDRTITAKELFTYVSSYVIKKSLKKQHPVMWGNFPDSMPIMTW